MVALTAIGKSFFMNLQELSLDSVHQNGIDDEEEYVVTKRDKIDNEIFIVLKKVEEEFEDLPIKET